MATYFWADTHFNHLGILGYTTRPWHTISQMNEELVKLWNSKVTRDGDMVWVLGDFGFHHSGGEDLWHLFYALKGNKSLIVGNHDEKNPAVLRLPWEKVERLYTFKENKKRAELCHYPLETWKGSHDGGLMLHGHSHGTLKRKLKGRWDVGVDTELGRSGPIPFELLVELTAKEKFVPTDAHGDGVKGDM